MNIKKMYAHYQQKGFFTTLLSCIEKYQSELLLGGILLVAFYLRTLIGLNWDQEQHLHPDERFLTMVTAALKIPKSIGEYFNSEQSSLSPYNNNYGFFVYGTFPIFLTKVISTLVQATGYDKIHILGRILSSFFDLGTITFTYLIGKKIYSKKVGLCAASFIALSVLHIQLSHFYGVELQAVFFITLTFLLLLTTVVVNPRAEIKKLRRKKGVFSSSLLFTRLKKSFVQTKLTHILTPIFSFLANQQSRIYLFIGIAFGLALASKISSAFFGLIIALFFLVTTIQKLVELQSQHQLSFRTALNILSEKFLQGILTLLATLLTFRIFQPYAFAGTSFFSFKLAPKFLENMQEIQRLMNGGDYPPSIQWVDRPAFIFPFTNMLIWGMGIFFGISAVLGILYTTFELVKKKKIVHLFSLVWIGFWFLYQGSQFVKPGRYLLVLYPFLALIAAYFLVSLSQALYTKLQAIIHSKSINLLIASLPLVLILFGTLLWALAFTSIYQKPVTRIAASYWIYDNIPCGAVLANEHWDDGLPLRVGGKDGFGGCYKGLEFNHYWIDDEKKLNDTLSKLEQTDYIILSSNRLYLSIPRMPRRFPFTIEYYTMLFSGELGFDLIKTFSSYPTMLGIEFNDDYAEEPFTVYDHPKVFIFKKSSQFNISYVAARLSAFSPGIVEPLVPQKKKLLLNETELIANIFADNRQYFSLSGISTALVQIGNWEIPLGAIIWWLGIELLGLITLPLCLVLFRNFQDRGYGLSKTLGILIPAWLVWLLASLKIAEFNQLSIFLALAIVSGCNLLLLLKKITKSTFINQGILFIKKTWKLIVFEELLFLLAFIFFVTIRMLNPDIWQPWRGGEKLFEHAFLAGITKSAYFPPYDPWFVGGYINYYYFGLYLISFLTKLNGLALRIVFTLATPTIFALTVVSIFSIVYTILNHHKSTTT